MSVVTFLGSEKSVWDEIGFGLTTVWGWSQEQRDEFKEALQGGYVMGNLDSVLSASLDELPEIQTWFTEKEAPDIHRMIRFRLEHQI